MPKSAGRAQEEHGEPGLRPDHAIRRLDAVRLSRIIWFGAWIGVRVGPYRRGPLEAIFLSTFGMISQNRADEKRQVLAHHPWQTVQQQEEHQNGKLLHISNQILELTKAIHAMSTGPSKGLANQAGDEVDRAAHDGGPNIYDSRAWESTVRRSRRSRIVVSDTCNTCRW